MGGSEMTALTVCNTQEVSLEAPRKVLPIALLGLGLLSWGEWIATLDSLEKFVLLIVGHGDILVAKEALLPELCLGSLR